MIARVSALVVVLLTFTISPAAATPPVRAHESADGLVLELSLDLEEALGLVRVEGETFHDLDLPQLDSRLDVAGHAALPFDAQLLAAPKGARVEVEVVEAVYEEWDHIDFRPAITDESSRLAGMDEALSGHLDPFWPNRLFDTQYLGVLRGVDAYSLRLFPISYDAAGGRLRACSKLRVAVRFIGGEQPWRFGAAAKSSNRSQSTPLLYRGFLNPPSSQPARAAVSAAKQAAGSAAGEWYDPSLPWVKVRVLHDGVYRIDAGWLQTRNVNTDDIDPRTLRLLHTGSERPLQVTGEGDGSFDDGDFLLFVGRYRRDLTPTGQEKDFDSIYGRENVYWLTWGKDPGRRFEEQNGAPVSGYPKSSWFWATAHFEQDRWFQSMASAPDNNRDHWFYDRDPIKGVDVDTPGSKIFPRDLVAPDLNEEYAARLRVDMHGLTPAHHSVLKLNNEWVGEYFWEGQDVFHVDEEIPSSFLRDGINRLLVQAFASATEGQDRSLFNFFAIDYRRRYDAWPGFLQFVGEPSAGSQITLNGFSHSQIHLFDTARELVFTGMQVDGEALDSTTTRYFVSFEDRPEVTASYVIADSSQLRIPEGSLDPASDWMRAQPEADYVIIAHADFHEAAERLAQHRRAGGLDVVVVDVEDIYDEFAHGLMLRESIRDFIAHAYHTWARRPEYVLLLGDATYDYRNILGGGEPSYVPTLYYQARRRGQSPSDFLFALVDGEDELADVAVGRLAVESADEASAAVDKIIRYDSQTEPGDWRSRVIYLANYHEKAEFSGPSDELAANFTEPFGLRSVKIYNPDEAHLPNATGKAFLNALNEGALLVNFNGHGAAGTMQFVLSTQFSDWDYLSQVANGDRLPLVLALSCLNGMFVNPHTRSLSELFTSKASGGSIAYISATALSFTSQNNLMSQHVYDQFFSGETLAFGPALNTAKARVLAAHPSWTATVLTMQLFGDPAQQLALPQLPDYQPLSLDVGDEQLLSNGSASVSVAIVNNTRSTADSIAVVLLDHSGEAQTDTQTDTLLHTVLAPFAGTRPLSIGWPLAGRSGLHRLELLVDPQNAIAELDEGNNRFVLDVEVLEPVVPELVFPPDAGIVAAAELVLEGVVEAASDQLRAVQFELSSQGDFPPGASSKSAPMDAADGLAAFRPTALPDGGEAPLYWRARLVDGTASGPWSAARSFVLSTTVTADGDRQVWRQAAAQMAGGEQQALIMNTDSWSLSLSTAPLRPGSSTREDGFTVRDLDGAGVLVSDGTYLYAKRWFNDDSTVYPGSDFFTRIGTGFGDTRRDLNYGTLADSTTAGISATYHSDGYIYNESGRAFELERLSVATGILDTVAVPDGLLEWKYGRVEDGHSLITSDGALVYNVSMSAASGTRTAWGVRVFDPGDGWRLVREFASPPTENGFTYEWTDGIIADGERLYFLEFGGRRRVRMVDAIDGRFRDEWTSDQDTTRIISGQYDWINNKVWLGDLFGPAVFRYSGTGKKTAGSMTGAVLGPAERWFSATVEGSKSEAMRVEILVPAEPQTAKRATASLAALADDDAWLPLPGFAEIRSGEQVDLSMLDAAQHPRLRLRAHFTDVAPARLDAWEVTYTPAPDLRLTSAVGSIESGTVAVEVAVRNLSARDATDAVVEIERTDRRRTIAARQLPVLPRGARVTVRLDSLAALPVGVGMIARVGIPGRPDAVPLDNLLAVELPTAGRLTAHAWPSNLPYLSGDPWLPGNALLIRAPFVDDGRISLALAGTPLQPDSVFAASPDSGLRVLYRPVLEPGVQIAEVRLFSGVEEVGSERFELLVGDALTLANVLVYPHPVAKGAAFTFVLSQPALVHVDIYSMGGNRVARVGPLPRESGFGRLDWDGRDAGGSRVASGSYLYVIEANTEGESVRRRKPLLMMR